MIVRTSMAFALTTGCASVPQPASFQLDRPLSQSRLLLTSVDFAQKSGTTLDAVRQLRPEFFFPRERSIRSPYPAIALYVDNVYDGDVAGLATIPLDVVNEVEFFRPMEAVIRFGTRCRCEGGAIAVRTRNRDRAP